MQAIFLSFYRKEKLSLLHIKSERFEKVKTSAGVGRAGKLCYNRTISYVRRSFMAFKDRGKKFLVLRIILVFLVATAVFLAVMKAVGAI